MGTLYTGQYDKSVSLDKIDAYNKFNNSPKISGLREVDVSKITEDRVTLDNGAVVTIKPALIANEVNYMLNSMRNNKDYSFLRPYIQKPVIWTYMIGSAATDGVRIWMSPAFAYTLLKYGSYVDKKHPENSAEAIKFWESLNPMERKEQSNFDKRNMMLTKYIRYVIVHECYHIFYNHCRRAALKYGSNPTREEHDRANIAMDLEINRDIESTFPDLRGATELVRGVWWKNSQFFKSDGTMFVRDIWEDIWDDWTENKKSLPAPSSPFNDENSNPKVRDKAQQGPYADGWRKAVDVIKRKRIDPKTFNI